MWVSHQTLASGQFYFLDEEQVDNLSPPASVITSNETPGTMVVQQPPPVIPSMLQLVGKPKLSTKCLLVLHGLLFPPLGRFSGRELNLVLLCSRSHL